jgi:hypothetical protein
VYTRHPAGFAKTTTVYLTTRAGARGPRKAVLKKISDYRSRVEQCPLLLRGARSPEEREMLLNMAETWEGLAKAREK